MAKYELKPIIFSTSKENWMEKDFKDFKKVIEQSVGVTVKPIIVEYIEAPKQIPVVHHTDGDIKPDWNWFVESFTKNAKVRGFNVVCFHMSKDERKRWGLSTNIGGTYRSDPDDMMEFWMCADKKDKAKYYKGKTNFWRIFLHELSHGFERWLLGKDVQHTHHYDYDLRAIDQVYKIYDWSEWNKQRQLMSTLQRLVEMLKKMLELQTLYKPINPDTGWKKVSQAFGAKSSHYPRTGTHIGTDFAVPVYTAISAPADGKIIDSGENHSILGNWMIYEFMYRGSKYAMRCLHLATAPKKGDFKRGEYVAFSGNTGDSTGPHCHLEIWKDSVDLNKLNSREDVFKYLLDPVEFFK